MSPLIKDLILVIRPTLNDTSTTASEQRYSDAEFLDYMKDGLREAAVLRPDLFSVFTTMQCAVGVEQDPRIAHPETFILVDVLGISGGDELWECDYATFKAWLPSWRRAPGGPAENWMRAPGDPNKQPSPKFYVTPPSLGASQVLDICIVDTAGIDALTLDSRVPLPEPYVPAIEAYMIFRAETRDDEHVNTQRAQLFQGAFANQLGTGSKTEGVAN